MRNRSLVWALALSFVAGVAWAESPRLLFDRSQVAVLRERIRQPGLAPIWTRILSDAEAFCDPASHRYADPNDPYPLPTRREQMGQRRHDALLVHTVGRRLADCTEAYSRNNSGLPGAVVQHARRHAFFVYPQDGAPAYAVIMDDIRKDERSHEFTWQMMFSEDMCGDVGRRTHFDRPTTMARPRSRDSGPPRAA